MDYVMWSRVAGLLSIVFVEDCSCNLTLERLRRLGYEDVSRSDNPLRKAHMAFKIGEEASLRVRSRETLDALDAAYDAEMARRRGCIAGCGIPWQCVADVVQP